MFLLSQRLGSESTHVSGWVLPVLVVCLVPTLALTVDALWAET